MALTITLSEALSERLQAHAAETHSSPDSLVEALLTDALPPVKTNGMTANGTQLAQDADDESHPTLAEVVAMIKATPPNPDAIHPATKTAAQLIAELEANPPSDELLTFEEMWPHWQGFEQELKAMDQADAISEGRG